MSNRKPVRPVLVRRCEVAGGECGSLASVILAVAWVASGKVCEARHVCAGCLPLARQGAASPEVSLSELPLA